MVAAEDDDQMDADADAEEGRQRGRRPLPAPKKLLKLLGSAGDESSNEEDEEEEEEQKLMQHLLMRKRLSDGCNGAHKAGWTRKSSLHLFNVGEELEPVTEGVQMRHMSLNTTSPLTASNNLACEGRFKALSQMKRNSLQEDGASCSLSSTSSLDGSAASGRRRSSTVSQSSSILSEGARLQLQFDLSPDLPLDSSLSETNAIRSPTDLRDLCERPATPEPLSFSSSGSFELLRRCPSSTQPADDDEVEDIMLSATPDDIVIEELDNSNSDCGADGSGPYSSEKTYQNLEDGNPSTAPSQSVVLVSENVRNGRQSWANQPEDRDAIARSQRISTVKKRAHTPFEAPVQRHKLPILSMSPSPAN